MSKIELIHGSCADQVADVVVNAANSGLWAGGGIRGAIFAKAGFDELTAACNKYKTPLKDSLLLSLRPLTSPTPRPSSTLWGPTSGLRPLLSRNCLTPTTTPLRS